MRNNDNERILTDSELGVVSGGVLPVTAGNGASVRRPPPRPNGSTTAI